ncbi:MAG: Pvc16 family protein [Candidatus Pacearchaeota archaeon]|nr:Pvc16 family protein [Candidatus Pacearchaeota archaeon]
MEQSNILQEIIQQFAQKFKDIAKVKIKDPINKQTSEDQPLILINVLGIEEVVLGNMNERIQRKGKDDSGNIIEYFVAPASLFNISIMVTPYFKTYEDTLKILGSVVKLIKKSNQIPVGEYDWLNNNNQPIIITPIPGMGLEKQMQIFNMLKTDYRPSLFYQFTVGIDSDEKDMFRRVEERKISAQIKKDQSTG